VSTDDDDPVAEVEGADELSELLLGPPAEATGLPASEFEQPAKPKAAAANSSRTGPAVSFGMLRT
jgi:hypothetical protein